jgi:outer membrane protein TolC
MNIRLAALVACLGVLPPAQAQVVNLDQAVDMALTADPRIKEREQLVEASRALLDEARANDGFRIDSNLVFALAPAVDGGFYQNGATSGTTPRDDGNTLSNGISDWTFLTVTLAKPIYTFGKVENYSKAAQGGIDVKRGDVSISRADTVMETKRAYWGLLTARDVRRLLEDVDSRVLDATAIAERALKDETGEAKPSDLYALQAARGLLGKYLSQARATEKIAHDGLKVLTGVGMRAQLDVAEDAIAPVPMPALGMEEYQARALKDRPEIAQLEAGLRARRALVEAKKSEMYPDIFAGVLGYAAYASQRDALDNPYAIDAFNTVAVTPMLGVKWNVTFDIVPARVAQAQAELEALNHKNQFAMAGIPFQVAEAYHQTEANRQAIDDLSKGASAARRWMIAALADFSAGLESADKVAEALKTYAITQAEYLRTVNDYNMQVAQLARMSGEPR